MAKFLEEEAYTFDDFLLVPQYTEIESRKNVNLQTDITKHTVANAPIISANMDTVTDSVTMIAMANYGCTGILHRFMNKDELQKNIIEFRKGTELNKSYCPCYVSIGVNDCHELLDLYNELLVNVVCIDIAHGDCKKVIDLLKYIKKNYEFDVITGNVCTSEATKLLCDNGADAIKVGVGPGSLCSTRLVSGCGFPQLSAIINCAKVAKEYDVPIIADGGITKSGDIVKALAAGASSVMLGGLLAGHDECPGEVIIDNESPLPQFHRKYKKFRGMASADAMGEWKGKYHASPEGESKFVECKGPLLPTIENLLGGIRSGMTYCNASTIEELQNNAVFVRVSSNTLIENRPHGK